jgi:hypothetical protein
MDEDEQRREDADWINRQRMGWGTPGRFFEGIFGSGRSGWIGLAFLAAAVVVLLVLSRIFG